MTQLTWNSATEWDSAVSESGVVHESVTNTDHTDATIVKQGYSAANPLFSANLSHLWLFHEDSGSTLYDLQGTNDGTASGATPNVTALLGTSGWSFDGTDDIIETSDGSIGNGMTAASFLCWIKTTETATTFVAAKNDAATPNLQVQSNSSQSRYEARLTDSGGTGYKISIGSHSAVADGNWHQVGWVFDGSTAETVFDGSLTGNTASFSKFASFTEPLEFGGRNANSDLYWAGDIGFAAFYSTGLTSSDIQTHYDVVNTSGSLITAEKTS